jgi:hypothetical protein
MVLRSCLSFAGWTKVHHSSLLPHHLVPMVLYLVPFVYLSLLTHLISCTVLLFCEYCRWWWITCAIMLTFSNFFLSLTEDNRFLERNFWVITWLRIYGKNADCFSLLILVRFEFLLTRNYRIVSIAAQIYLFSFLIFHRAPLWFLSFLIINGKEFLKRKINQSSVLLWMWTRLMIQRSNRTEFLWFAFGSSVTLELVFV